MGGYGKMKAIIYGAGLTGEQVYHNIKKQYEVIGFLDGNAKKKGMLVANAIPVLGGVEALENVEYDKVFIGSIFYKDIKKSLIDAGVRAEDIVIDIPNDVGSPVRNTWLECWAELHRDWKYAVAEGGVFRGEFSSVINRCFPNSKMYLFDTFEGFDERDLEVEKRELFSDLNKEQFSNTSEEIVLSKLKYKENVEIHKGFFPETAKGISDSFGFVNLDFDLYQPILEGLRFFYPQMVDKSLILIHDYYNNALPGVKKAIADYEKEIGRELMKFPIGDYQSIAVLKE